VGVGRVGAPPVSVRRAGVARPQPQQPASTRTSSRHTDRSRWRGDRDREGSKQARVNPSTTPIEGREEIRQTRPAPRAGDRGTASRGDERRPALARQPSRIAHPAGRNDSESTRVEEQEQPDPLRPSHLPRTTPHHQQRSRPPQSLSLPPRAMGGCITQDKHTMVCMRAAGTHRRALHRGRGKGEKRGVDNASV